MQAKSGAPAAPVVSTVTANSNQQLKQPPVSKINPPGEYQLSKKPPIPQWRKKDKPLEQGVFYKVKDGEYHRVKNDPKKDDKMGSVSIDLKAAAGKLNNAESGESRWSKLKWTPLMEYFQNVQTIYVLLSIIGVVVLLIVILCLIPFNSTNKHETVLLKVGPNASSISQVHNDTKNSYHQLSSTKHQYTIRNSQSIISVIDVNNKSPLSNQNIGHHTTAPLIFAKDGYPIETSNYLDGNNLLVAEEESSEPPSSTEAVGPKCQPLKYHEISPSGAKSLSESSYSCEKSAPIIATMPQFLTIDRSVAFGYPISQIIICNNAIALLTCPPGQLIHIYSAYYGVQSDTATPCVVVTSSTPALCFSNYTLNRLNAMCEAKQSCSILVTSSNFGEPCLGFNKQMVLQYQCVDETALTTISDCPINSQFPPICPPLSSPSNQNQQIWCEPSTMLIECSANQVISILCAFYGKDPNYHCPGAFYSPSEPTYCYSQSSMQKIRSQCNGKRTCQLSGDPDFVFGSGFLNPCPGFAKILFIQWECVSGAIGLHDSQSQLASSPHWSIMSSNKLTNKSSPNEKEITKNLEYCDYSQEEIECSSSIPYVPRFLANSTETSFGYPIHQQIICNTGRIVLLCPNDLVLHIHGAYYGIQWPTTENSCIQTRRDIELPAMCFFPSTFDKLVSRCESNSTCVVEINRVAFGDPCPGYTKQFFIQYQCIERTELARIQSNCSPQQNSSLLDMTYICPNSVIDQQERTWCAHDHGMNIKCAEGRSIQILCAFYGINHHILNSCTIPNAHNAPVCYFHSSLEVVKAACNNKTECHLSNFKHTFTDPCRGFEKALFVRWKCV